MKIYRVAGNKANFLLIYVVMIALLVFGRDTLIANEVLGFVNSQILAIVLMGILGIAFLVTNRKNLREIVCDRRIGILLVGVAVYALPMVLKLDFQLMYMSIALCIVFGVFASYIISMEQASKVYVITMCVLTLYSFVATYLLKPMTITGYLPAATITNDAGLVYYNFGLSFAVTAPTYMRNVSLFRESGVFSCFLLIAIFLNNEYVAYRKKYISCFVTAILSIGVISTFSTAGIIILVLLLGFIAIEKRLYNHRIFWIFAAVSAFTVLLLGVHIVNEKGDIYWELYSMVTKMFSSNDSKAARIESVFGNIRMFANHFLFGDSVVNVMYSLGDNTASSFILFALCGILGGVLNVFAWCVLLYRKNRNSILNGWLLITMFMMINPQNITTNIFFWLFPMLAVCRFIFGINHKEKHSN